MVSMNKVAIHGLKLVSSHNNYERFEPVNETAERVYEDCDCLGTMSVMEYYLPQYNCKGINYCIKTNYSRER